MHKKNRYYKIEDVGNASTQDRIRDLKIRANHYARHARKDADRNLTLSKSLKLSCFALSALSTVVAVELPLEAQAGNWVPWTLACCGFLISLLSGIQLIVIDEKVSAGLFAVSRDFASVREKVVLLEAELATRVLRNEQILERLEGLYAEYISLKDKYIDKIQLNKGYYGFWQGPGRLKSIEKICDEMDI